MKKLILSLLILFSSVSIFSQIYDFNLSIEPVYSLKNGRLYEYVKAFDQNSQSYVKMSELDWNLTNLSYLGGRASLDWKYLSIIAELLPAFQKILELWKIMTGKITQEPELLQTIITIITTLPCVLINL